MEAQQTRLFYEEGEHTPINQMKRSYLVGAKQLNLCPQLTHPI